MSFTLQFTSFNTEKDDQVYVWGGARTTTRSVLIDKLAGKPDTNKVYRSPNNFVIIQFFSDSSVNKDGFSFTWTAGKC